MYVSWACVLAVELGMVREGVAREKGRKERCWQTLIELQNVGELSTGLSLGGAVLGRGC